MPAGPELAALRQLVRLIGIHPSASGCTGTGVGKSQAPYEY
ncbi:MAG: hypothetical protein ACYC9I_07700 [Desulfuromonadales bacterium]